MNNLLNHTQYVEVEPGVRLHLTDRGSGRPVVLIHGWPLSDEIFKYQYQDLTDNGYRVIGITLRGFGKSDKPTGKYDFATFAKDLHTVLRALSLEDVILLGYSFGGIVATHYLATYSPACVTRLVLLSSNVPLTTQLPDHPYGFSMDQFDAIIAGVKENREVAINVYGPIFRLDEIFLPTPDGDWINRIMADAAAHAMTDAIVALRDVDQRALLAEITIPTAIFHAFNDNVIPMEIAREAQQGIKGAVLITFEEGGHWIFIKERKKFTIALLRFIDREAGFKDKD